MLELSALKARPFRPWLLSVFAPSRKTPGRQKPKPAAHDRCFAQNSNNSKFSSKTALPLVQVRGHHFHEALGYGAFAHEGQKHVVAFR
ncbi:MAG: hypothetical protein UFX72_10700, partial [Adlercreutzia sp.]|nr:hypothetical protein [Adlercreutzia sp.]